MQSTTDKETQIKLINLQQINDLQAEIISQNHKIAQMSNTIEIQERTISALKVKLDRVERENQLHRKNQEFRETLIKEYEESKACQ